MKKTSVNDSVNNDLVKLLGNYPGFEVNILYESKEKKSNSPFRIVITIRKGDVKVEKSFVSFMAASIPDEVLNDFSGYLRNLLNKISELED